MQKVIEVQNLKCQGCASTIRNKVGSLVGISSVEVDADAKHVTVSYSKESDLDVIHTELAKIGYPPVGSDNNLVSKAKSFVSCAVGRMDK